MSRRRSRSANQQRRLRRPTAEQGQRRRQVAGTVGELWSREANNPEEPGTILTFAARMRTVPYRILIVRPSALGDVCRTVPLLAALRFHFPASQIDWVVQDAFVDAVRAHPALHACIPFPRQALRRWWSPAGAARAIRWARPLRRTRYDLAIDAQGLMRSALICWFSGAPRRIGPSGWREGAAPLWNERVRCEALHDVDRTLALATRATGVPTIADMRLTVPSEGLEWWSIARVAAGVASRYAVFAPTSRWPSKQWPDERWVELARQMLAQGLVESIVVLGAPGEEPKVAQLLANMPPQCQNFIGRTAVGQAMAAIAGASVVVSSDSAALHMAVGLGVPYVALMGPTDSRRVGPWQGEPWTIAGGLPPQDPRAYRRCDNSLMARIPVDAVLSRVALAQRSAESFRTVAAGGSPCA